MKINTQQPLKRKWTSPIDRLGKFHSAYMDQVEIHREKLLFLLYAENKEAEQPVHEISNNRICANSKASDQPAHTRSLIRAFASRLNII